AWNGTAAGGTSPAAETSCVEGVNCDTFNLTLDPLSDWTGKIVSVKIDWSLAVDDYDLYLHKGSNAGPVVGSSAGGAPSTEEAAAIDPSATGTGAYTVHVVYFSVPPGVDQYRGTAAVAAKAGSRSAIYVKGGLTFSPSVRTKAPVAGRDGEPSSRTDKFGNHYVSGIRGVPAGVDLWYFDLQPGSPTYDPKMRNPIYRGQPDSFTDNNALSVGADGGGDVALAVGFDGAPGGGPPLLASSSLVLANISTQRSSDRGVSFLQNPAGNATGGVPVDDRQWLEFYGNNTVYLLYRTVAPAVTQIQRSIDGGLTYGPAATAGAIGQVGAIDVDQNDGTVYVSGSSGQVCVGIPPAAGLAPATYTCHQAASDSNGVAHLFFVVKVAADGTAYVAYSNDHAIYLAHSTDKGNTWSQPVRVSDGPETATSVLPAIETGPAPGSVGIAWYGTTELTNNDNANWKVFYAVTFNGKAASPTFQQVTAGDHVIHASNISEGGTLGNANRNLLDYFQISFDPTGAAVIDYTDDHNDFDGHTYVMRQTGGPGIRGTNVPAPVEGGALPPATAPGPNDPQVTDFAQDVATGLLAVIPANDPLDILSIRYSCQDPGANPMLVVTMKVSDLSTVPPVSNWRMHFAANAPDSVLSPTGDYTFGLSDRGDQFYVRASTDPTQTPFSFGTAKRKSDGSLAYTEAGPADSGAFDSAKNTITVAVSLSKLNQFLPAGHAPIGAGSVLVGLRGGTFTSGANAKRDIARGGTQYKIVCSNGNPGGGPGGGPGSGNGNVVRITGGGSIDGKRESFTLQVENNFSDPTSLPGGRILYHDNTAGFDMVSDQITSFVPSGNNEVTFTGNGHVGSMAVTFRVTVDDNGEPGVNTDRFAIDISGYPSHSGFLSQGNIQFHR
ncbi:MAG: post-COAP-1 domain-containing protein, partial [Thermoanaerobaculia bacterium]